MSNAREVRDGRPRLWSRGLLAPLLVAGCADFSVRPASDPAAPGLHFFLPKPYILFWWERTVTFKSGGTVDAVSPRFEIIYLPDLAQRYTVTQRAVLAKGDFAYTLANGWSLQTINGGLDTTEALRAVKETGVTAMEKTLGPETAPADPAGRALPPPVLYEPVWDAKAKTYRFRPVPLEGFGVPAPYAQEKS
jgi:hypothetical protein